MNRWYRHGFNNPLSLKLIFSTIPRLPKWVHPPIAVVTALLFFFLLKDERKAVAHNLRRVTGAGRARVIWKTYQVFYSFCDLMVSYCYVPNATHEQLLAMLVDPDRGQDTIDRCLSIGNGLIVWTAHVGNWEMGSALPAIREDRVVNLVREGELDPESQAFIEGLLQGLGGPRYRTHFAADDPRLGLTLFEALRRGEIVALQADRPRAGGQAETVELFGTPYPMPVGPVVLARSSGAPLVPNTSLS